MQHWLKCQWTKGVFTHTENNGSGFRNTMTMRNPEFRMVAELWSTMRECARPAMEERETVEEYNEVREIDNEFE
eukprot:4292719-Amphidinium_carterae.1